MRSLIVVTILCLTSTAAFACTFDTDCKPGLTCSMDGACVGDVLSGSGHDNVPAPAKRATGKTCDHDGDCRPGSSCIKGSGLEGVCIGH